MNVFAPREVFLSLIVGAILAACCAAAWRGLDAESLPMGSPSVAEVLWMVALLFISHEALHLIGFPGAGLDSNTVIGIWPQLGSPYVQYLVPVMRNRFIIILFLPFLILSILPPLFVLLGNRLDAYLSWISVINCLCAGSDIFILSKVISVVPANASVMESDGKLYWAIK